MSKATKNIYQALWEFQSEVRTVEKNAKGYGYKYASLDKIINTIGDSLTKSKLVYRHYQKTINDRDYVVCELVHIESGEKLHTAMPLVTDKAGKMTAIQQLGSARSYLRRYTLIDILGLVAEEDNDGASMPTSTPKTSQIPQKSSEKPWFNPTNKFGELTKGGSLVIEELQKNTPEQLIQRIEKKYRISEDSKKWIISKAQEEKELENLTKEIDI